MQDAKAMLFDGLTSGLIVGSSNLTRAGLTANLELNLGRWDPGIFTQAKVASPTCVRAARIPSKCGSMNRNS
jgi:phosphatidylserine/phosphatidylglycerophosphate/cardiolipin synthase-like enzyme